MDAAWWAALRALEEQSALSAELAALRGPKGGPELVNRHTRGVDHAAGAAVQIRQLLAESGYRE